MLGDLEAVLLHGFRSLACRRLLQGIDDLRANDDALSNLAALQIVLARADAETHRGRYTTRVLVHSIQQLRQAPRQPTRPTRTAHPPNHEMKLSAMLHSNFIRFSLVAGAMSGT